MIAALTGSLGPVDLEKSPCSQLRNVVNITPGRVFHAHCTPTFPTLQIRCISMASPVLLDVPSSAGNILLVSDSRTQLDLMKLILADVATVLTAENGAVAEQLGREQKPDLIISDVVMPAVDGI